MEVFVIPPGDVTPMESRPPGHEDVDFFASGTLSCLLNCRKKSRDRFCAGAVFNTQRFKLEDLITSTKVGCRGCQFLRALVEGACKIYPELEMGDPVLRWAGSRYTLEIERQGSDSRRIQFFNPKGANIRIAGMPSSSVLTGDTSSNESLDRAQGFIQNCEAEHDDCGIGRGVQLPKRLLNVKQITNSKGDIGIRLETTEGQLGTYSCLSHCWGDPTLIRTKLLCDTEGDYHDFIPWLELPKTFQDAVILCRRLGLEYIWIDSLCIIQDSARDWEDQSSKMGDIYGGCYVTIAAAASPGSSGGCFSKSLPDSCFALNEPGRSGILVGVRDCQGTGSVKRMDEAFAEHFPLFRRAWVYQERMLSRRTLYCSRLEFQVGCRRVLLCECGAGPIAPHFSTYQSPFNIARLRGSLEVEATDGSTSEERIMLVYRSWLDIVESFAKLNITKGGDKLPALSATAKHMAQGINSDYLAGIWRLSLMEGLLWFARGPLLKPRPRGQHWRAPSWSWASIDAPSGLGYMATGERFSNSFCGKIEAAECTLAGQDETGQVTSAFIRVRASLGNAFWRRRCTGCSPGRSGRRGLPRADYALHAAEPSEPEPLGSGSTWVPCSFTQRGLDLMGGAFSFYADAVVDDLDRYGFESCVGKGSCKVAPCYLLHVPRNERQSLAYRSQKRNKKEVDADAFLVLARTTTGSDTFERVGLIQASHDTAEKRNAWFEKVWSSIILPEKTITLI